MGIISRWGVGFGFRSRLYLSRVCLKPEESLMNLLHLEVREESESSSLEQEALKDQFLAGLADTTNRAKANLRNTVLRLLALGLSRKTLVDWAVTAKYSASYARGILSELLRRTEGRTRK